jgi:hypothetical protein
MEGELRSRLHGLNSPTGIHSFTGQRSGCASSLQAHEASLVAGVAAKVEECASSYASILWEAESKENTQNKQIQASYHLLESSMQAIMGIWALHVRTPCVYI